MLKDKLLENAITSNILEQYIKGSEHDS